MLTAISSRRGKHIRNTFAITPSPSLLIPQCILQCGKLSWTWVLGTESRASTARISQIIFLNFRSWAAITFCVYSQSLLDWLDNVLEMFTIELLV